AGFATVCRECPAGCGVLARNRDGRVVKLEGNPDHPVNRGGLCIRGQAGLQGLYHPDRFSGPQRREGLLLKTLSWGDALKALSDKVTAARGAGKGGGDRPVTQPGRGSPGGLVERWGAARGGTGGRRRSVRVRGWPSSRSVTRPSGPAIVRPSDARPCRTTRSRTRRSS